MEAIADDGGAGLLRDALDALGALHQEYQRLLTNTPWEIRTHADLDALALVTLAVPNVAAVERLGREALGFVVPATGAGRSAFEAVVTAAWMLALDEAAERERRWITVFLEERSYWHSMVELNRDRPPDEVLALLQSEEDRVGAFVDAVVPQLQAAGVEDPARRLPKMEDRLQEVGEGRFYATYKTACQLVHPASEALALVRDLHDHAEGRPLAGFGFRARAGNWTSALLLSAEALGFGMETLATRVDPRPGLEEGFVGLFNEAGRRAQAVAAHR